LKWVCWIKDKLVEKLFLIVNGKTSQGVWMIWVEVLQKVKKYTQKMLYAWRFCSQQYSDDATNKMVNDLIHNYKIKLNDLQGIT
jgi:DNA-directed RNA polymerase subunit beta